jgi:hypothetical protein
MEKVQVTPVSQYASFLTPEVSNTLTTEAEPLVELPTDEINIEKANEVEQAIVSVQQAIVRGHGTLRHLDGTSEEIKVFPYPAETKALVQQSISTLKELTNNPEVQKVLEAEGLTVDYGKVHEAFNATGELEATSGLIRPLTEEEKIAVEGGTCACTDCIESIDSDVDVDTMLIVHDLAERVQKLEERLAAYNIKASHKI